MAKKEALQFTVYMATNTVNGHRYIGVTSRGLSYRRKRHLHLARIGGRQCPRFYDALRKYGAENFVWQVLGTFSAQKTAYRREHVVVDEMCPEYNAVAGGCVGPDEPWNKIAVVCLEDGVLYESATAAAKAYEVDVSEVCKVCRDERRWALGKHFRFSGVLIPAAERNRMIKEIDRRWAQQRRRVKHRKAWLVAKDGKDRLGRRAAGPLSKARAVVCLDDGRVFASASSAAQNYDVARSALVELCLGKNGRKTVGGFRFKYVDDIDAAPSKTRSN